MAWEICISADGWQAIRNELDNWTIESLISAIADDKYERIDKIAGSHHAERAANSLRAKLSNLAQDILADACFELIETNNTCENGGNGYWIDREGYHRVYTSDN